MRGAAGGEAKGTNPLSLVGNRQSSMAVMEDRIRMAQDLCEFFFPVPARS